jgi:hypothetical protein
MADLCLSQTTGEAQTHQNNRHQCFGLRVTTPVYVEADALAVK